MVTEVSLTSTLYRDYFRARDNAWLKDDIDRSTRCGKGHGGELSSLRSLVVLMRDSVRAKGRGERGCIRMGKSFCACACIL